jgi:spore maturation protein CgeB
LTILYVGELTAHTRSYQRFVAMRELGHDVVGLSMVPPGAIPSDDGPLLPRVFSKMGLPRDTTGVNHGIIAESGRRPVDLVWIEKGLSIRSSTLENIRSNQPPPLLTCYSEDDMFARHNQSRYYRDCLPLYDVVFTTKSYNCHQGELPSLGARRVVFVDKAYDRHCHRPIAVTTAERDAFGSDVGFIGSFEAQRAEKLDRLGEAGLRVRVWGNGWRGHRFRSPNVRLENRAIFGDDYVRALCSTKINLCFLRKTNRDLQTDRTLEIPACGAFMLAERTDEHRRLFAEDQEAVYFDIDDDDELIAKARHYLAATEQRESIAAAGRRRCVTSAYSHHERLTFMLDACHVAA